MIKLEQVVAATEAYVACLAATEKLRERYRVAIDDYESAKKELTELESKIIFTANVDLTKHKQLLRDLRIHDRDMQTHRRLLAASEIELTCLIDILRVTRQAYFKTKELVVLTTGNV